MIGEAAYNDNSFIYYVRVEEAHIGSSWLLNNSPALVLALTGDVNQ